MSFEIVLMTNNSEKNKVTKKTTSVSTINGTLKQATSIIDPVLLIEGDLSSLAKVNYVSIPSFNRYYFVTNIRSDRNSLIEISCHVDVLMSFASEIKKNNAIIRRQEKNWNLYLNDGVFKTYQNPEVLTKAFPSGFSTQEFVLALAGR